MAGRPSTPKPPDQEVWKLVEFVKADFEKTVGHKYPQFIPVLVSEQVVDGTNFFVKVSVGNEKYVHLWIFRPLPGRGDPKIVAYQLNKSKDDKIHFPQ